MSQDKHIDRDSERICSFLLQQPGLNTKPISTSADHKTPDLVVRAGKVRVLIEVERKADDKQFRDLLAKDDGATLQYSGALARKKGLSMHGVRYETILTRRIPIIR